MKGVYIISAPPEDLSTASAEDLARHGLLWPGPVSTHDPTLLRAWRWLFSRKWLPKNRIVPQFGEPKVGRTHLFRGQLPIRNAGEGNYLTGSWSGVAIGGGEWSGNAGAWTVPTVSQPTEPQGTRVGGWSSGLWVGIDGYDLNFAFSNDVLQAGVRQTVNANGQASYYAWYEWFAPQQPNSPGYIFETPITNLDVSPGQKMFCMVNYVNQAAGYIFLGNETTGKHFSITLAPPPGATFAGNTIEWIMEAPDGGEPLTSLPKFTPVNFSFARGWEYRPGPIFNILYYGFPIAGDTLNIETPANKVLTSVSPELNGLTIDFIG